MLLDNVTIVGVVKEYFGRTQIADVTSVTVHNNVMGKPDAQPVPIELAELPTRAERDDGWYEKYEGMMVTTPALTVTENYKLGRYGEVKVSSSGRIMNPTQVVRNGPGAIALRATYRDTLVVSDDSSSQNPDPLYFPYPELSATNTLRCGFTIDPIVAPLSYSFSAWRLELPADRFDPAKANSYLPSVTIKSDSNPRLPAPKLPHSDLRVASFNVLNFFNGDGQGGGFPTERGANTQVEFTRQQAKIVNAIVELDARKRSPLLA